MRRLFVCVCVVASTLGFERLGAAGPPDCESHSRFVAIDSGVNGAPETHAQGWMSLSGNGRFIAFTSSANNLIPVDPHEANDVFVRDTRLSGPKMISADLFSSRSADRESYASSISDDGRTVAFTSDVSDIVESDGNGVSDVIVSYWASSVSEAASVRWGVGIGTGNGPSTSGVLSADGRHIVFVSDATNLVPDPVTGTRNIFARDLVEGLTELITENLRGTDSGIGEQPAGTPVISAKGRFVAFASNAGDLVEGDTNGRADVFVRDRESKETVLVSVNAAGTGPGNGSSEYPAISDDGRFVAFESYASDLVEGDDNGSWDVFVRDVKRGKTHLVSVNRAGTGSGNGQSRTGFFRSVDISADGSRVAFSSDASDLVRGDSNGATDVFVRDLRTRRTRLVSVGRDGAPAGGGWYRMARNGSAVTFDSREVSLDPPSVTYGVFVRDLRRRRTELIAGQAGMGHISRDGRVVAFSGDETHGPGSIFAFRRRR